jgi:hypothetical protein
MSGKTTYKQNAAIAELLSGKKFDQVAGDVGINVRTLHRWWSNPVFRVTYYQEQTAKIDQVLMPLVRLSEHAVNALADVIRDPRQRGASNRRLAAQAVIDAVLKMRDRTIDQRLTELEAKVYGKE